MSLDSPDGLDDCCRGSDFSGAFTLPIRAREITLADIATTHEKREAVQFLLPHPLLYRVPRQGSGAGQATGEGAGGPCRSKS